MVQDDVRLVIAGFKTVSGKPAVREMLLKDMKRSKVSVG